MLQSLGSQRARHNLVSVLLSRFWIIFIIIILHSFSDRFPISSSFVGFGGHFSFPLLVGHFSAFSSCLDCCVWSGLSVFCWSVVPFFFYCEDFTQWVGLDGWLVKVSWLGKLVSVFWCMEMDFFSLECNGVPSNEFCNGSMC